MIKFKLIIMKLFTKSCLLLLITIFLFSIHIQKAAASPSVEFLRSEEISSELPIPAFQIRETSSAIDLTKTKMKFNGMEVIYKYDSNKKIVYYPVTFPLEKGVYPVELLLVTADTKSYSYSDSLIVEDKFQILSTLPYPNPCTTGNITFRYTLTKDADWAGITIYDLSENIIFKTDAESNSGINEFSWDCTFEDGKKVPYGSYYYKIESSAFNGDSVKKTGRFTLIP